MQTWIVSFMSRYGYLAVAGLIAIENIFPPIPSEIILTFGGFMTTYSNMSVPYVILFATLGSLLGAIVLYGLGRMLCIERLEKWLNGRLGKLLHVKISDIYKAQAWFEKRGNITIFFCRFIPIIRSLISIPAGMAKMNVLSFCLLTTVGTGIWNTVLVILGKFAGNSWETIVMYIAMYSKVALVIIILALLTFITIYIKKSKKTIS